MKEDVEKEWIGRVEALEETVRLRDAYIQECEKALEKERKVRRLGSVTSRADS